MRGEAVTQGVGMDFFLYARSQSGFLARIPNRFRIDRVIPVVVAAAWKQPCTGLSRQAAPVLAQCLEQFWTEHHIAISASLSALDVDYHALAVDIVDLQMR